MPSVVVVNLPLQRSSLTIARAVAGLRAIANKYCIICIHILLYILYVNTHTHTHEIKGRGWAARDGDREKNKENKNNQKRAFSKISVLINFAV
jgi:Ca2+/H+ antiporter